jgi:exoribonuclease-2
MERYWCLRWLAQQKATQVDAVVLKDEVVRLVEIPLIIKLPGMRQAPRGTVVKLDLIRWDEIDLTVEARLLEIVGTVPIETLDEQLDETEEKVEGPDNTESKFDDPIATNDQASATEPVPE